MGVIFDDAFEVGLDNLLAPDLPFNAYFPGEEGGAVGIGGFPWWRPFYVWRQPEDVAKIDWDKVNDLIKRLQRPVKKKRKKRGYQTAPTIKIKMPRLAEAPRLNLMSKEPTPAIGPRKLPFRLRSMLAELTSRAEAIRAERKRIAEVNRMLLLDLLR